MSFAAIHIPDFIVQALVRGELALRERAVTIVEGTPPLWSVVAANPRAVQVGIELGMAKSQAAQFAAVEIRIALRRRKKPLMKRCWIWAGPSPHAWRTPPPIPSSSISPA